MAEAIAPVEKKFVVRISEPQYDQLAAYAEKKGITVPDAADRLVETAISRLAALTKYGKKQAKIRKDNAKPKEPKPPKPPKVPKEKKVKVPKEPKEPKPEKVPKEPKVKVPKAPKEPKPEKAPAKKRGRKKKTAVTAEPSEILPETIEEVETEDAAVDDDDDLDAAAEVE